MARTLPLGRISKTAVPDSVRRNGVFASFGDKGFFGEYFDQLMFESHSVEHILGDASQLASDFATMTWSNSNARFEDKAGGAVVLGDFERVAVIGMDTLTANLVIDNVKGLEIKHLGATPGQAGNNPKFQLGDAGSGEPFKFMLGPNAIDCKLDLLTDKPFSNLELSNLTITQKQYVANQGKGNHIKVNGEVIYNPSEAGQIVKYDTTPKNPYFLRMNGALFPWQANAAVNNEAWFRDLNIALDGQRADSGGVFAENQSRFTPIAIVAYRFQLNTANRFFTDVSALDSRIHSRTDPTGVSQAEIVNFVNTSNVVTFQGGIGVVKNGMRLSGADTDGIPDATSGTPGTTIVKNINTTAGTAEMFDALTGASVNATATFNGRAVTLDNSGAAGGSKDDDFFQGHLRDIGAQGSGRETFVSDMFTGAVTSSNNGRSFNAPFFFEDSNRAVTDNYITDGSFTTPRPHDQTQPKSSAIYYFYKT